MISHRTILEQRKNTACDQVRLPLKFEDEDSLPAIVSVID
jgi:hypothetical protein